MKIVLKIITFLIVIVVFAGIVLAFIKTDLFLDNLEFLLPLADKLHLTRWSSKISMDFFEFINKGYVLNLPNIEQSKTSYTVVCVIGAIMVLVSGALIYGMDKLMQKVQVAGLLTVVFAAVFGLDFVLAVIMISLVIMPFAG